MITRVALVLALAVPPFTMQGAPGRGPCPVAVPARTVCGFLEVPERRDAPGRTVRVGYAVRVSTARDRKPDPVVYMSGGPGSASMRLTGFLSRMFPDRDVVTIEQRGSRYSEPSLGCPETARALLGQLREPAADVAAAALRCRDRLQERGVDLRGYRTKEIAADVVALRRELGYPSWNLFGVGYSTRVMLAAAAADPRGVRSVVLDSFLPERPGWYDGLDANLAATMARLGVRDRFEAAVARLNAAPARVPAVDPLVGGQFTARISGDDLAAILAEALRDSEVAALAPAIVTALAEGRDEPLRPLADAAGEGLGSRELGLYHAVRCQDEVPFNGFATGSRPFTVRGDKAVCDAWKLPASTPAEVSTNAPVYVLAGQYDPTPARTAGPAAAALPGARFEEFPGISHAVFLASACARRKIADFVATPAAAPAPPAAVPAPSPATAPVSDPCLDAPARAPDLHLTAAPYRISRSPWLAAPFALYALTALTQLVAGALKGRSWAAFGGLSGVAFTGLIVQSVATLAAANGTALAVGIPATALPYTWVAVASTVLTAAALRHDRRWPQVAATVVSSGFLVWWCIWCL